MSWIWEKSPAWRAAVRRSRVDRRFFAAFAFACVALPWVAGSLTMAASSAYENGRRDRVAAKSRPDAKALAKVNSERLGQFLDEIKHKEDTDDRYKAALRGETLTGTPTSRMRGGGGTSMPHLPTGPQSRSPPSTTASPQEELASAATFTAPAGG